MTKLSDVQFNYNSDQRQTSSMKMAFWHMVPFIYTCPNKSYVLKRMEQFALSTPQICNAYANEPINKLTNNNTCIKEKKKIKDKNFFIVSQSIEGFLCFKSIARYLFIACHLYIRIIMIN